LLPAFSGVAQFFFLMMAKNEKIRSFRHVRTPFAGFPKDFAAFFFLVQRLLMLFSSPY